MEKYLVKVHSTDKVTHDVLRLITDRPAGYVFNPGQATEIAINKTGWQEERRPFTFTCLPTDDYLEFTIKTYPAHRGVTNELLQLKRGDGLFVHDVFGAIAYKDEGVFIAGGAGVTPFIAILRYLQKQNKIGRNVLLFANKTKADIILEKELSAMLGKSLIHVLSDEKVTGYDHGMITEEFLKAHVTNFGQQFYVCGPPPMMDAVLAQLKNLGVGENAVTVEI